MTSETLMPLLLYVPKKKAVAVSNATLLLHFNDNLTDSASGIVITNYGATFTTTSRFGSYAIQCPSTKYLKTAADAKMALGTKDFTVEAWVYGNGNNTVLSGRGYYTGAGNNGITFHIYNAAVRMLVASSSGTWAVAASGASNVPNNQWNHIAMVRQGSVFSLYLNGILAKSSSWTGSIYQATTAFYIGTDNDTPSNGNILDEIRVTVGTALYTSNFTVPTSAPT